MKPTWESPQGDICLYLGDCLKILPLLKSGFADLILTDPPYGIAYDASHTKYKNGIDRGEAKWDEKPYDPAPIIKLNIPTIMWGGNCFSSRLPDSTSWLCWRKTVRNNADIRQSDMELAWTNCIHRPQTFEHLWIGAYKASESGKRNFHPTQKPIAVMMWCLSLVKGKTIFDPYMGSGTTGVACVRTGRKFIGIEIDPNYFEIAKRRIETALAERDQGFFKPKTLLKSADSEGWFPKKELKRPKKDEK